ncbi:MAG: hypothetical protein WB562_06165 [Candidatus Sulfotelmatobacter sp.]
MFRKFVLLLVSSQLAVAALFAFCTTESDELSSQLATPVHDYNLTANSLLEGLTLVASEFRVPIGIEWVNTGAPKVEFNLHLKEATVGEIIETVARTQPGYDVRVGKGAVHVYSTEIPREQDFLLIRIGSFMASDEVVEVAERRLREVVKLTTVLSKGVTGGTGGSLATNVGDPKINVRVANATVEDVLDALAAASPKKIWIVTFTHSLDLTPTGFRRTANLRNSFPVPDDEQPVWETFRWGEPISPAVSSPK